MKIPGKIRIAGVDYVISRTHILEKDGQVLLGEADVDRCVIRLNNLRQEQQNECITLLHEVLHVLEIRAGLELGEQREHIIDTFAQGIYQVLADNGKELFCLQDEDWSRRIADMEMVVGDMRGERGTFCGCPAGPDGMMGEPGEGI